MGIVLGANQYGKAETRLVRVTRDGGTHTLTDLNVSVSLAGDLVDAHLSGDNGHVLPTDTQKNTVYAFARRHGVTSVEAFGLLLARHFVASQEPIHAVRVRLESYSWTRLGPHSFQRDGAEVRTATVTCDRSGATVVSGVTDLVLLNSTGSEFVGYRQDGYTTLAPATDRILATAVTARWRHASADGDWDASYAAVRSALVSGFVETYSRSLQQTLYAMGERVLTERPDVVEVRMSMPNRHHFAVDLTPFGLDNPNEVFYAADRPYGLIEGTVLRDDAPAAGLAWW
ncbi:factor-independent urate hydroxylase [Luedemannella helvata]|uniref:Uricase n=1 Tax=Luedemannella helvata TaxID=349315 RepID=A0ABN2WYD7_9ACTN